MTFPELASLLLNRVGRMPASVIGDAKKAVTD
jgi:hypothetical protein